MHFLYFPTNDFVYISVFSSGLRAIVALLVGEDQILSSILSKDLYYSMTMTYMSKAVRVLVVTIQTMVLTRDQHYFLKEIYE